MNSVLTTPVLVLNRLWQPVNTCSARRAVTLVFLGHAQVVQADEQQNFYTHDVESWLEHSAQKTGEQKLRSVSVGFDLPRIIVLSVFDRLPKKEVKFTRQNIFLRDKHICQYCGTRFDARDLNLDHVVPRDKGGKTTWENLVTSCVACNSRKGNKLTAEANMFPLHKPVAPRWRPFFSSIREGACHESWRHFLDLKQASVEMSA